MSCPTCGHSMTCITNGVFWCNRCGTVSDFTQGITDHAAPKLVERCRKFEASFPPGNPPSVSYSQEWKRLGIAESINLPGERS